MDRSGRGVWGRWAAAWVLAVAALPALPACSPTGGGGQGPGHRSQALGLTPAQELSLGRQAYEEVLSKAQVEPSSSPESRRVREVGGRIVRAVQIEPLQREINLHLKGYTFEWEFKVLRDKRVNAFCLPGGKVAVFTGLFSVVGDDDDYLATVMSHEIAHALAHHASERVARQMKERRAIEAVGGVLGRMDPEVRRDVIGVLAAGAQVHGLKYDRQQESEADHIGIFLMTFAGYDPRKAVAFWQRMEELSRQRGRPPAILSDHPSDAKRIADIGKWVPMALGGKRAFDEGRIAR